MTPTVYIYTSIVSTSVLLSVLQLCCINNGKLTDGRQMGRRGFSSYTYELTGLVGSQPHSALVGITMCDCRLHLAELGCKYSPLTTHSSFHLVVPVELGSTQVLEEYLEADGDC